MNAIPAMPDASVHADLNAGAATTSLSAGVDGIRTGLRSLASGHLQLLSLESRRAGESLLTMLMLGLTIAGLLAGAWVGLLAVLVLAATDLGMSPVAAVTLMVALNLVAAWACAMGVRHFSRFLGFPATLRQLRLAGLAGRMPA
jgi:uncharacterized membrane protein YqjE